MCICKRERERASKRRIKGSTWQISINVNWIDVVGFKGPFFLNTQTHKPPKTSGGMHDECIKGKAMKSLLAV